MNLPEQKAIKVLSVTPEEALQKLKSWCAYQERSQDETRRKLSKYALAAEETESIISILITENYLNEERFALAYAGGKFRIKHWGKIKIRMGLKKHQVSDYCINKALNSIGKDEYADTLRRLLEKKSLTLGSTERRKKFYTLLNYALAHGFEGDLVTGQLTPILDHNE